MRLGTSTNLLYLRPDGSRFPLTKTLQMVSEAGFRVFDLNFYDWSLPGSPFLTGNWERWIDEVAKQAADLGVSFGQCHAYFYNFLDPTMNEEERQYHHALQERSLLCCKRVGAHTCVLHPETAMGGAQVMKDSFRGNGEYFKPLLERLSAWGMRLALENMCDYQLAPRRKFCAYPEELVGFAKWFGSGGPGICWDFEHGDIMEQDQVEALRFIGPLLFATHVSDTHSKTDSGLMHVLPMTGGIRWLEIMETLKEIGYQGDFCYEVHNYCNRLPDQVIPAALRLAYEIGEYLMGHGKIREN